MNKHQKENVKSVLGKRKPFRSSNGTRMISGDKYRWQVDSSEYLRLCFTANPDAVDEDYYWSEDPTVVFNIAEKYLDTGILHSCNSFKEADVFIDKIVKAYKGKFIVSPLYLKNKKRVK